MAMGSSNENFSTVLETVVTRVSAALRQSASPLVSDPHIEGELVVQITHILEQTFERLGLARQAQPHELKARGAVVGDNRARQNVHPVDSLKAATLVFDIGLGAIVEATGGTVAPEDTARALNASVMETVIPASVSYVNVLLDRLAVAHREERLAISRELHDRVAHSIAAGMQRVDLSELADAAGTVSAARLVEGMALFDTALEETRAIARDLRHFVGEKRLDEALDDYVADLDDAGPRVVVEVEGDPFHLSAGSQEEAFIIIREAIHNARRHSQATQITARSTWRPDAVHLVIEDDGRGFEHDHVRSGALGLIAAQERAELIGADLMINPGFGRGTCITLRIPVKEGGL